MEETFKRDFNGSTDRILLLKGKNWLFEKEV